jgi:hypothetical protein
MNSDPHTIIDHLSPGDALAILRILVREDDQLVAHIAEVARSYLSSVDPEEIALDLYAELDALDVEEVWDRAGPTRHGYVEPEEASSEMIEQVVEPFLQEMTKYAQMGLHAQAKQACIGLLLGLYRFERESTNEFKDWAVDEPAEFASEVIDRWNSGSPSAADVGEVKQFIDNQLNGWVTWRQ